MNNRSERKSKAEAASGDVDNVVAIEKDWSDYGAVQHDKTFVRSFFFF